MKPERNEQLIARRKTRNLSQEQVAEAVGISYRNYQNIETGKCRPNVETAISIAELLKCEVPDLFGIPRVQPGSDITQPNYSNSTLGGVGQAKELESAIKSFGLDVDAIIDIAQDGRLDEPARRETAERLAKVLVAVLSGKNAA